LSPKEDAMRDDPAPDAKQAEAMPADAKQADATPADAKQAPDELIALETALHGDGGLAGIIESARRLGVEIDETEAAGWVAAMEAEASGQGDLVVDVATGVYGHRASMLDFSPGELARFRRIGKIVGIDDRLPAVRTALALSGSAAQSRIQRYPGDCDYFERVHIVAPTRAEACSLVGDVIRDKALATRVGPTHRLWEVKFGSWPFDVERDGVQVRAGAPISWRPDEIEAGRVEGLRDGVPAGVTWEEAAVEPGWCKLDWIVADQERRALANASNMLDVTWEAPDGTITALDGFIDPYFQEVYLETDSLPIFERIVKELAVDSVDEYVTQLEHEVVKYTTKDVSYGKAARRMYNIFRLTGRFAEAAYLRELFDEPTTVLYQVAALIRTLDEADRPGAAFETEMMRSQADDLIMAAVAALDGPAEAEMVARLLEVRETLGSSGTGARTTQVGEVKDRAIAAVNDYFRQRLVAVPSIAAWLAEVQARA
jgi:hypothetical protein